MSDPDRNTLTLAHGAFTDRDHPQAEGVSRITPDAVTRFALDKKDGYRRIQLSDQVGPQSDGMLDLIDVIRLKGKTKVNFPGHDRALIVRVESTRGMDSFAARKLGEAIEAYMGKFKTSQFATAAIGDLDIGKELHGKWNTLLLLRGKKGTWSFMNLRFASVAPSTDGTYAILRGRQIGKIDAEQLVATLLDDLDLQAALDSGHELEQGKYHLVRAPIDQGGAYAVVGSGTQVVYNDRFEVIASGKTDYTVMPAIDVDGTPIDGQVTTVSGKGNDWTVQRGTPASSIQGSLARAYETPSA